MEGDFERAALLLPHTSGFTLREVSSLLRACDWRVWEGGPPCDHLPDRIEQDGDDGEVRVAFGTWAIRIWVYEHGARGVHARIETNKAPEEQCRDREDFPTEEAWEEYLHRTPYYFSFFESCLNALLSRFPEAAAFHYLDDWADVGRDGVWWNSWSDRAPPPTHLAGCLAPARVTDGGTLFEAAVRCSCGGERVEVHYHGKTHQPGGRSDPIPCTVQLPGLSGYDACWFGLKTVCPACRREQILFDSKLHGWDAVAASSAAARARAAALPRPPLVPWACLVCGATAHACEVRLRLPSPGGFLSDTFEDAGWPMPRSRRAEAFGWFGLSIRCCECGRQTDDWAGYETR